MTQALTDQHNAGRPYWMLITQRDRRTPLIFIPRRLYVLLNSHGASLGQCIPQIKLVCFPNDDDERVITTVGTTFEAFKHAVHPNTIRSMALKRKT